MNQKVKAAVVFGIFILSSFDFVFSKEANEALYFEVKKIDLQDIAPTQVFWRNECGNLDCFYARVSGYTLERAAEKFDVIIPGINDYTLHGRVVSQPLAEERGLKARDEFEYSVKILLDRPIDREIAKHCWVVGLRFKTLPGSLVISNDCLVKEGNTYYAFVLDPKNTVIKQKITFEWAGVYMSWIEGLSVGDRVLLNGDYKVGTRINNLKKIENAFDY